MKFIRSFKNDDHFKRSFAIYHCDVPGCLDPRDQQPTEKTVQIEPKNFDETCLIRCPKCGQFSGASKKQQLIDKKNQLLDKIKTIDVELEILEMTESKVVSAGNQHA